MTSLIDRFNAKVNVNGPSSCHVWTAARNEKGYGRFMLNGRNRQAHVVAWEIAFGPVPQGLHVLHRCDNPPCVNPAHLFLGTNADNIRDRVAKGRSRPHPGELNGRAKLHPADILKIRSSSATNTELAKVYGVTRMAIAFVRWGKNWRHI